MTTGSGVTKNYPLPRGNEQEKGEIGTVGNKVIKDREGKEAFIDDNGIPIPDYLL